MYNSYIMQRSITYAKRAQRVLASRGIASYVTRPPLEISGGECAHALKVKETDLAAAASLLRVSGVPVSRAYVENGFYGYREVII